MPNSTIEYYYSAHSAFAYLGAELLTKIVQAAGVTLIHKPMNLTEVVGAANPGGFTGFNDAYRAYFFGREIERWAEYRNVSIKGGIPSNHRNDISLANKMLIAAILQGRNIDHFAYTIMEAHWKDHSDLADSVLLAKLADAANFDSKSLLLSAVSAGVSEIYEKNTQEAIERSVFGSPTYFVKGDMFYGQDHLELVERALRIPFKLPL